MLGNFDYYAYCQYHVLLACTHVMSMVVQVTIIFDMVIWGFMVMAFYELAKKGGTK